MNKGLFCVTIIFGILLNACGQSSNTPSSFEMSDPVNLPAPPEGSDGYPLRHANLDALPGFQKPRPGYGQVPFWWWTGGRLDKDRLLWQIEELHRKGVSGMQVNYAHEDTPGWPTYPTEPAIFSDQWWDIWKFVVDECAKRDMGIGLSGYTIDWPNGKSLISSTIYCDPEIQGREIIVSDKIDTKAGMQISKKLPRDLIGVHAYSIKNQAIQPGGLGLSAFIKDGQLEWTPSQGQWQVWVFTASRKAGTLNPMHPLAGKRVIEKFFQRFQDNAANQSAAGLNYFFHDELKFGVGDKIWVDDFAEVFRKSKGYDVFEILPAMFQDIGTVTAKGRLDFMDVRVQLAEDRYFKPIFDWHWSRGKIYGCDQGGRGKKPLEFGDYFRSARWYTAPGHDTPGGKADLIKGKVSSSIAHLYKRPRVWLEGYHSLGWGATPEMLMNATCENYIYGCNLLNLHGLYYSTHGSYWEWAPPSYHFRMPYWEHMDVFMEYFERLSYLMSQGVHCCDVAMLYPVAPVQAGMGGKGATETAFDAGTKLVSEGIDFDFMDFQSLDRAEIKDGKLHVSGEKYSVLVLPAMKAVRWSTILKAREFYRKGGKVIAIGALPEASDRAGADDLHLDEVVKDIFGTTIKAANVNNSGGVGLVTASSDDACAEIVHLVGRDVKSSSPVKALHRKIGYRDVYMVMGPEKNSECFFRSHGAVELWDPWTGQTRPLSIISITRQGTTIRMPLEKIEAQVIVFDPTKDAIITASTNIVKKTKTITLDGLWESEFKPTINNIWGDFRLPVTKLNKTIGPEARIFKYAPQFKAEADCQMPEYDDQKWPSTTYGFGPKFLKLGPLDDNIDHAKLRKRLAALRYVDSAQLIEIDGEKYYWTPYEFSWRFGVEGDPGPQGFHGLKGKISDDFICLGRKNIARSNHHSTQYEQENGGSHYYLWTSVFAPEQIDSKISASGLVPSAVYINGTRKVSLDGKISLMAGSNPLLLCYDKPGRGHFVFENTDSTMKSPRTELAMKWYDSTGILPFDIQPAESSPAGWYRFTSPPGLKEMNVTAYGHIEAWADGKPMIVKKNSDAASSPSLYHVENSSATLQAVQMVLRIEHQRGCYGGSAMAEPIVLNCGMGLIDIGDWSKIGVLENYSGGLWYRKTVDLTNEQVQNEVLLNMTDVVATAEVHVNGNLAGIRVAPPWKVDISEFVKPGKNKIEIFVCNTLSNHYLTTPTWYRGSLRSGLIGPVTIEYK